MGYSSLNCSTIERVSIGNFATPNVQTPSGQGDAGKIRINFGAGGNTDNNEFSVDPDGTINCLKNSIQYEFDVVVRVERQGNPGNAEIMGRLMYAEDGIEGNAIQFGDTFNIRIDDDNTVWREEFLLKLSPKIGSKLWFELAIDESGVNAGQLGATQPTGTLSSWNPVNTASLDIGYYKTK